jgi:hypothetical protein
MATHNGKIVYVFDPVGWDIFDARSYTPDKGALLQKTQPAGCPKNGTMKHCYVALLDGTFLGLVHQNSLKRATKADVARAVETAEQTVARLAAEVGCRDGVAGCYYSGNDRHPHADSQGDPLQ